MESLLIPMGIVDIPNDGRVDIIAHSGTFLPVVYGEFTQLPTYIRFNTFPNASLRPRRERREYGANRTFKTVSGDPHAANAFHPPVR
jgi:hypothetical protein